MRHKGLCGENDGKTISFPLHPVSPMSLPKQSLRHFSLKKETSLHHIRAENASPAAFDTGLSLPRIIPHLSFCFLGSFSVPSALFILQPFFPLKAPNKMPISSKDPGVMWRSERQLDHCQQRDVKFRLPCDCLERTTEDGRCRSVTPLWLFTNERSQSLCSEGEGGEGRATSNHPAH